MIDKSKKEKESEMIKNGFGIKYANKEYAEKNGLGKLKVIVDITDDYEVSTIIDDTGELCITGDIMAFCYDTKEELYLVDKALHTEKMKDILKSCDWGGNKMDSWAKVFSLFKKDFYNNFI